MKSSHETGVRLRTSNSHGMGYRVGSLQVRWHRRQNLRYNER
jgi:hypothetical protein